MIKRLIEFMTRTFENEIRLPAPSFGVRVMDDQWLRETFRNREAYIRQSRETRNATLGAQPRSFAVRVIPDPQLRLEFTWGPIDG